MQKAVIFDLDDTLCNTGEIANDALHEVLENNPHFLPHVDNRKLVEIIQSALFRLADDPLVPVPSAFILMWFAAYEAVNEKPDLAAISSLMQQTRANLSKRMNLLPGSLAVLNMLNSNQVKIGILTNGVFLDQVEKITRLGLTNTIDCLVTADMCAADKPAPRAFHYILEKLAVAPEHAVMIGDNYLADIIGAKNIGMKTIYLANNAPLENTQHADHIAANYADVARILQEYFL